MVRVREARIFVNASVPVILMSVTLNEVKNVVFFLFGAAKSLFCLFPFAHVALPFTGSMLSILASGCSV